MINPRPILLVNGILLMILAAAMLLPALLDFIEGSEEWKVFVTSSFMTAFVGGICYFPNRGLKSQMAVRETFLFTTSSWFIVPLFAGIPLQYSSLNLSLADAFFECVSSITTTGSTVIVGLDNLDRGLLLWRAVVQALGSVGVVVLAIAILPMLSIGGMQLFKTESSDTTSKVLPRAGQIAKVTGFTYAILVLTCTIALWVCGMSGLDAICHAIATIGTGGFSTHDASIGYFNSFSIEIICIIFMIAGGVPMLLYYQMLRGRPLVFWEDSQVRTFIGMLAVASFLLALWRTQHENIPFLTALREVSFSVVSIITTTGFVTADYALWGNAATVFLFMLLVVGGCTGSTSGGIKIFRFQVLYETARVQLSHLTQPSGVFIPRYDGRPLPEGVIASVLSFFVLFALCFVVFTVLVAAHDIDFLTSMSAVAQAMANVGPGLGPIVGPMGNFASMPDGVKWLLSFAMIFGRLELFTVLVLFTVRFWRD